MNERYDGPDADLIRAMMQGRLTRRSFLRTAGVWIGSSWLLAACGGGGAGPSPAPEEIFRGPPEGQVDFANWPIYIDKAKDPNTGERYIPSLRKFTEATGITVTYKEVIQDNPSFFGKLEPQLAAGQSTGWDIIVITNGWEFSALVRNGWVLALDTSKRPSFDQYAIDWAKDPSFDPGAKHSMAYQSGLTGIAVNLNLVHVPITKLDDLANPEKVGKSSVGMITDDMPDFVMINLGIDPKTSGPDEWRAAADWLRKQREAGVVRQYYAQGYADDMTAGNLAATMAWSGDVLYYSVWGGYDNLEFVFPEGGALLWTDNMMIPTGADHPISALTLMDFFYRPDIATMVQEWVFYMSPCAATRERIQKDAAKAEAKGWKGYAAKLRRTAESEYLFPGSDLLARSSFGRLLRSDDEKAEWDSIFVPISEA